MSHLSSVSAWSPWHRVPGLPSVTPAVLAETLDGGQSFRWHQPEPGVWEGIWSTNVARLRLDDDGQIEWAAPSTIATRVGKSVLHYLGGDTEFAAATDALPWRSDAHLAKCLAAFPGLRILRQPFGETLLGFLCSATKQIVQIKQMVALLATRHGRRIEGTTSYQLPTWDELAGTPEIALRECLLGFRARYISETARYLANHRGWLEDTVALPYSKAKARLCELPGVGEKVADCVLLFGGGRLEAFPVDVWILKTLAKRYELHGWKPAQLTQFGRAHFGPHAGLAQQFLFAWERRFGTREPLEESQRKSPDAASTDRSRS
jgi:N-glycosylase/DNA lyase